MPLSSQIFKQVCQIVIWNIFCPKENVFFSLTPSLKGHSHARRMYQSNEVQLFQEEMQLKTSLLAVFENWQNWGILELW